LAAIADIEQPLARAVPETVSLNIGGEHARRARQFSRNVREIIAR
jgi:hypothetical protein